LDVGFTEQFSGVISGVFVFRD